MIHSYTLPAPTEPTHEEAQPKGFALYRRSHFRDIQTPKGIDVLGHRLFGHDMGPQPRLHLLLGQGSIGKSSWALGLAVAQIRGDSSFCGFPLNPDPRGWLFIGSENNAIRWKTDLDAAEKAMDEAARERLESRLFVAGVFDAVDDSITLPESAQRLRQTVLDCVALSPGPLCVVLDPWSDLTSDELDTSSVTKTLKELRAVFAGLPNSGELSPAVLIIAHSKVGKDFAAGSTERFDGGSSMRGNKGPYNKARTALALYPRDGDTTGLVLSATKCNDGDLPKPRGLIVDRDTLSYRVDPDFDVDTYRAEMKAKHGGKASAKVTTESVVKAVREGTRTTAGIVEFLAGVGCERSVKAALAAAIASGDLQRTGRGEHVLGPNLNPK